MKQPIFTPKVSDCAICSGKAKVLSWDFNEMYRVMCDKNHTTWDEYLGSHRAICKWNNLQEAILKKAIEK